MRSFTESPQHSLLSGADHHIKSTKVGLRVAPAHQSALSGANRQDGILNG